MRCPYCLSLGPDGEEIEGARPKTIRTKDVLADDPVDDHVRRHRECPNCGGRFKTYEGYELSDPELMFRVRDVRSVIGNATSLLEEASGRPDGTLRPAVETNLKLLRVALEALEADAD